MALIKPYSAEGQPQNAAVRAVVQLLAAAFERLIPQIDPVPEPGFDEPSTRYLSRRRKPTRGDRPRS
jgi:hypothetical protein